MFRSEVTVFTLRSTKHADFAYTKQVANIGLKGEQEHSYR
jgi:hypothetical protein